MQHLLHGSKCCSSVRVVIPPVHHPVETSAQEASDASSISIACVCMKRLPVQSQL
jgi:hypothetical protein